MGFYTYANKIRTLTSFIHNIQHMLLKHLPYIPGVVYFSTPASPLPIELVAITENV